MRLTSALVALAALTTAVHARGFADSCHDYTIDSNGYLKATCAVPNAADKTTQINLSNCLGNAGGRLQCQVNGGAMGSCRRCFFGGGKASVPPPPPAEMECDCGDGQGGWPTSWIDLNNCVSNTFGTLTCP
ncbi:Cyanovirin-N [Exidia glandulosa HHB12029]|uniref:Cyanovirin-N n=1 Tax=Exidia glandulosa HHB12029 TaxID=1314781 RepID=A0A165PUF8_EXIGL|nr:Cyanovirin-N [Exidia glandulosa HHB12029]